MLAPHVIPCPHNIHMPPLSVRLAALPCVSLSRRLRRSRPLRAVVPRLEDHVAQGQQMNTQYIVNILSICNSAIFRNVLN